MSTPAMVTAAAGTGHRITADEYEAMIRDGVLTENDKVELIDGQLEEIVPKGDDHVWACGELVRQLEAMSDGMWHARKEDPARVSDYDEPEPDITVATGTWRGMKGRRPRAEEILLVTEVAATTQEYDRGEKRERYARAAIPVYWIVDLKACTVEVYTDPDPDAGQYRACHVYGRNDRVPVILAGRVVGEVAVADLLLDD